jgi:hypothetical protein
MNIQLKAIKYFMIAGLFIVCAGLFSIWQNNSIVVTQSDYMSEKIPVAFDAFKIVQISDLHNKLFGEDQEKLLGKVRIEKPDIILITGDLIDQRKYDLQKSMIFIRGVVQIAPVYYVSGNHEAWSGHYESIKNSLLEAGVSVLDNSEIEVKMGEDSIHLLGLADPDFLTTSYFEGTDASLLKETLKVWSIEVNERFNILLSHRPELYDVYRDANIDLVFTGHAHGGQVRLPFMGGLVAPDQGFFPEYTSGRYTESETTMFVSRGLGNSIVPQRLFNRPEIVVVTLRKK